MTTISDSEVVDDQVASLVDVGRAAGYPGG